MRLKKYDNLPNCEPVRIPYEDKVDQMFTLLNDIQPHKDPEELLDAIIKKLEKDLIDLSYLSVIDPAIDSANKKLSLLDDNYSYAVSASVLKHLADFLENKQCTPDVLRDIANSIESKVNYSEFFNVN